MEPFHCLSARVCWGRQGRRTRDLVREARVLVFLECGLVAAHVHSSAKASIKRRSVKNRCILNVIASEAHDGHGGILARRQLLKVRQLDRLRLHHWLLRISHQVEQRVSPVELIIADRPDRLLAHSALIGVPWRLVMMRIGDQTSHHSEYREGVDFHVGGHIAHSFLAHGDERIILFVNVQVLEDSFS